MNTHHAPGGRVEPVDSTPADSPPGPVITEADIVAALPGVCAEIVAENESQPSQSSD